MNTFAASSTMTLTMAHHTINERVARAEARAAVREFKAERRAAKQAGRPAPAPSRRRFASIGRHTAFPSLHPAH